MAEMEVYERGPCKLVRGDCLSVMPALGLQVDSIITDPPYHLTQVSRGGSRRVNDPETPFGRTRLGSGGFMGKTWDGGDVAFRPETWAAALECTKPGGFLLAFGGTRTFHRLACAIEDAGWEIRDCIMWVYGSGFPKSLDISKAIDKAAGVEREVVATRQKRGAFGGVAYAQNKWTLNQANKPLDLAVTAPASDESALWSGYGTALKPAWEPIIVAMKPLDGTFAENAQKHGVAGMAIDACRIESEGGRLRIGEASAGRRYTENGGTDFAATPGPRGGDPMGRFPANLIHDGSDEVLAGFPVSVDGVAGRRSSGVSRIAACGLGGYDEPWGGYGGHGSAARFFYCAKASRSERGRTNTHPTVKPLALMRYLCRLTKTPTGGIVLDPFAGSGSTLIAAAMEGREAIGIEQDDDNYRGACERLLRELNQGTLQFDKPVVETQRSLID